MGVSLKEQDLGRVYAKCLIELCSGKDLENGKASLTEPEMEQWLYDFLNLCSTNLSLEQVLFGDQFTQAEKLSVLADLLKAIGTPALLQNFFNYLLIEKRFALLPAIYREFVSIQDSKKGLIHGTIEGAEESVPAEIKKQFEEKLSTRLAAQLVLVYQQNKSLTAGYRITAGDVSFDATMDRQFDEFMDAFFS
jgi:F0F1-type ATP synthase delta subunit